MVDFEKALLKTKLEKLESELNYTTTERDNLLAQANDDQRYIRQCESTIKELDKKLDELREQLLSKRDKQFIDFLHLRGLDSAAEVWALMSK